MSLPESNAVPRKGQRTRARIVRVSAALMNRQGFLAAPMAEVVAATGLGKGGLYRHFESREALGYAAFDHAVGEVRDRLLAAVQSRDDACDRLLAMLDAYAGDAGLDVPLPGGCPIMNTAIEADHAHAGLRARARAAMNGWHRLVAQVIEQGMRRGEIRPGIDPSDEATLFIAAIEGGVMLAQLHADATPLRTVRRHLERHVRSTLRAGAVPVA